ncbi:MAG: YlbF family regulator [Gemmatimonadaceae bacterium]|nr:YlbF family regulator [Gemmatimonadaceae bacterium]NUP72499.1 YlbF family regulator [Gemmatimonadaceae bacterium]NUR35125.1 YlbF family regulator [Gemmatimonadaceae bacterium]NUS33743.1 YlbF family regulator [Gemmatimonadaceae bacterium]NUS48671.1 YlbF family regulator [Gemmatimonadaceae bacterium]
MIEDKAKELGRLIGQSPEYQAVKRANDALSQDAGAVALLRQMEQLRINAQQMLQRGERPTEEMEKQLDGLLGQVQGQSVYQRLVAAQENFDKVMGKVNDWIVDGIERGAASPIITLG